MRGHVAWAMAALCLVATLVFLYCAWRGRAPPAPEEMHGARCEGRAMTAWTAALYGFGSLAVLLLAGCRSPSR